MKEIDNLGGMDTSGISAETFGSSDPFGMPQKNNMDAYAAVWSSETSYAVPDYNSVEQESVKKEGRGLEVATLIFGILAILMCCCNGFFGIIGFIMGIIAIAKGKRSGMTIAGMVCSIIGLIFGLLTILFSFSDYGQELQDTFWEGFEQEYESISVEDGDVNIDDTNSDEMEEYEESPVESHDGTIVVSDAEASKIMIDGNEITLPCTLSDIMKYYEVSSFNEDIMRRGLEAYATEIIYLADNGLENGVYVVVENDTEETIANIENATVNSISIDDSGELPIGSASIFNNVSMGMSSSQVEDAIKNIKYNKSEMSGYVFYNIFVGDEDRYSIALMLSDDKVVNISVYYSNY